MKGITLKDLAKTDELLAGGHRLCPGCGHSIIMRQILHSAEDPVIIAMATGCLEVCTTIYPYTSWRVPWIHSAFENAAATIAGVEAMYQVLRRRGKIGKRIRFIAIAGDGGTYDIGLQSLSGALERGHDFLYICTDNEAYMNTGTQRSSSTPLGADTTTSPVGKKIAGKKERQKDLTRIVAAHNIPYLAQASPAYWKDLITKFKKALAIEGPTFLNVLSPCPRGWRTDAAETVSLAKLAVDTCFWPLYEVENGKTIITYKLKEKKPIEEWLRPQGRFQHFFKPGNEGLIAQFQADVNRNWDRLIREAGESA